MKTDAAGNVYVGGDYRPFFQTGGFLAKISPDGMALSYFAQIPGICVGTAFCEFVGFALEPDGSAYVATAVEGSLQNLSSLYKLDPTGIDWQQTGTYLMISDLTADAQGNVYLTGTDSRVTSTTGSLSGTNNSDNFIVKLDGRANVIYALHNYGGLHIAVDANQNVFAVAADAFGQTATPGAFQTTCNGVSQIVSQCINSQYIVGIDSTGTQLLFATYLTSGGSEEPAGIAVGANGNIYVAGTTASATYPVTPQALEPEFQAQEPDSSSTVTTGYVSALNPTGSGLVFSTFFGGSDYDTITSLYLDDIDNLVYLAGNAVSPDLPGIFGVYRNCVPQSYVVGLTTDGAEVTRANLVGPIHSPAVAIGSNDNAWIVGGYVSQVDLNSADSRIACLADSAGNVITTTATPGQLLTIYGNDLSTLTSAPAVLNEDYVTSGTSASVTINGVAAPLLFESPHQLNVQVPFEVAGQGTATINIQNAGVSQPIATSTVPVLAASPSIFEVPADSVGCTATYLGQLVTLALNQDGTVNGCSNPAKAGSTITIFVDGIGVTSPAQATGNVVSSATPLNPQPTFSAPPPTLVLAEALVGSISGVYAFQIQVPGSGAYQFGTDALGSFLGRVQVQIAP